MNIKSVEPEHEHTCVVTLKGFVECLACTKIFDVEKGKALSNGIKSLYFCIECYRQLREHFRFEIETP